jgi:HK97 gp10 family phage protein
MAKLHFTGVDDVIRAFDVEAGRIERNGDAAVEAGAEALIESAQKEVPVRTGGLRDSITTTKVTRDERGNRTVTVYPDGVNPRGERYATIANVLEYGRSNTPPDPWMERAGAKAESAIDHAMLSELEKD